MSKKPSRREFLSRAGKLAAAGTALSAGCATTPTTKPPRVTGAALRRPASERIRLGFIGVGGMGKGLLKVFMAQPDTDVVAIADVYDKHCNEALNMAREKGHKPDGYRDFRRILDRKDIDAVVIATPDHWHALTTIYACHAGKDVYVEKPLSHTIVEGRAMINTARRFNRVTQMGIQMHANENFHRTVEIVQSGMIGQVSKARAWVAFNRAPNGYGKPANEPPPADCDYDMWLGPAPKRPFNRLRWLVNFRYFWDYAGGLLSDFGCHLMDPIHWALKLDTPTTVMASGGRYAIDDLCETPDTMEAVWEFPATAERKNPLQVVWSIHEANSRGVEGSEWNSFIGIAFYGTKGSVVADYKKHEVYDERKRLQGVERPKPWIPDKPRHRREFLDCVKSRKRCSGDFEYGHQLTSTIHMGNIALRTGQKLTWDAENERFENSPKANRMLSREYRAPWRLPT